MHMFVRSDAGARGNDGGDEVTPRVVRIAAASASSSSARAAAVTVISAAAPDPVKYGALSAAEVSAAMAVSSESSG